MFDYDPLALNVIQNGAAPGSSPTAAKRSSAAAGPLEFAKPPPAEKTNSTLVEDNVLRRLSGESNDTFDSGASSGYGSSCTGTPLASPALLPTNFIAQNLQKMLTDCEMDTQIGSLSSSSDGGDLLSFLSEMKIDPMEEGLGRFGTNTTSATSTPPSSLFSPPPSKLHSATPASAIFRSTTGGAASALRLPSTTGGSPMLGAGGVAPHPQSPLTPAATPTSPPAALEDGFSPDEIAQFAQLLSSPKKTPPAHYQCHICFNSGHYISDCPMRFNSSYEELTPYQGRKKCYGEFTCHQCKRRWTSQNSVANEAQNCIKCSLPIFPHKQLPVDKAIALGLVKAQRTVPTKLAPIGSGRVSLRQQ